MPNILHSQHVLLHSQHEILHFQHEILHCGSRVSLCLICGTREHNLSNLLALSTYYYDYQYSYVQYIVLCRALLCSALSCNVITYCYLHLALS